MNDISMLDIKQIMEALSDGVYVCDIERRITYWSKSAERITGWRAEDIVGRRCFDDVLCHVDKDGHRLCGEEYCPLHRAMVTGTGSKGSLLVYAQGKHGRRIPMEVSVAPIHNAAGQVIGGVETFRDASETASDLRRAQAIQELALQHDLPQDARVKFTAHYVPHGIVGGDYYAVRKLNEDQYALMLADVMGHGVAAALYTMHLSSLWNRYHGLLTDPVRFVNTLNNELARVVKTDGSFATAVCGLIDLDRRLFRFVGAGGPYVLLIHSHGTHECLEHSGLPLAIMEDAAYSETAAEIQQGDRLLFFSDGAVEVHNAAGEMLGVSGLMEILGRQGYPRADVQMDALEEELLRFSNSIRLEDDLTLIEVCLRGL
jgi:sigma-B regulation protein RsbU (phosphoserine phosphatase)